MNGRINGYAAKIMCFGLLIALSHLSWANESPTPRWFDLNQEIIDIEELSGSGLFEHEGSVYFTREGHFWSMDMATSGLQKLTGGINYSETFQLGTTSTFFLLSREGGWQLWRLDKGTNTPIKVNSFCNGGLSLIRDFVEFEGRLYFMCKPFGGTGNLWVYDLITNTSEQISVNPDWNVAYMAVLGDTLYVNSIDWAPFSSTSVDLLALDSDRKSLRKVTTLAVGGIENTWPVYAFNNLLFVDTDVIGIGLVSYNPADGSVLSIPDRYPSLGELSEQWLSPPALETDTHLYFARRYNFSGYRFAEKSIYALNKESQVAELITPFPPEAIEVATYVASGELFTVQHRYLNTSSRPKAQELFKFDMETRSFQKIGFSVGSGTILNSKDFGIFYSGTTTYLGDDEYTFPANHNIWHLPKNADSPSPVTPIYESNENASSNPNNFVEHQEKLYLTVENADHLPQDSVGALWKLTELDIASQQAISLLTTLNIPENVSELLSSPNKIRELAVFEDSLFVITEGDFFRLWSIDLIERNIKLVANFSQPTSSVRKSLFVFDNHLYVVAGDEEQRVTLQRLENGALMPLTTREIGSYGIVFHNNKFIAYESTTDYSLSIIAIDNESGEVESLYNTDSLQISIHSPLINIEHGIAFFGWDRELELCRAYFFDMELQSLRVLSDINSLSSYSKCSRGIESVTAYDNNLYLVEDYNGRLLRITVDEDPEPQSPIIMYQGTVGGFPKYNGIRIFKNYLYFATWHSPSLKRINLEDDSIGTWSPEFELGQTETYFDNRSLYLSGDVMWTAATATVDGNIIGTELLAVDLNRAPQIETQHELRINEGENMMLDASQTSDPDGDTLTYLWKVITGDSLQIENTDSATPNLIASQVDGDIYAKIELTVSDGFRTSTALLDVTVLDLTPSQATVKSSSQGGSFSYWILLVLSLVTIVRIREKAL